MLGPIESRTYHREECAVFRKTDERFGGLSNMAPGYALSINGVPVGTAEAIYQACRFPHLPDVQHLIIDQTSPMTAKMRSKPYREKSRLDWDDVRVPIMRWCLRVKLIQNWDKFQSLLLETGELPIVEDSRRDDFWGAVASKDDPGVLVGRNVLGRLLMELRERIRHMSSEEWRAVSPPKIPDFLLFGKPIGLVRQADSPMRQTRQPGFAAFEAHR
jgi:type I restriction enzyme, S subunit